MKKLVLLVGSISILTLLGCSKPDHIITIKSPVDGIFYTAEIYDGSGPVDPDFTKVYANLKHSGQSDRKLVMDGGYLDSSQIVWVGPRDVMLCSGSGPIGSFRSEVTLVAGGYSETIHNHLKEHCATR